MALASAREASRVLLKSKQQGSELQAVIEFRPDFFRRNMTNPPDPAQDEDQLGTGVHQLVVLVLRREAYAQGGRLAKTLRQFTDLGRVER